MKIPWRLEVAEASITHSWRFSITCNLATRFRSLDWWIAQLLAMKKGLRSRSKRWATSIPASVKLVGWNFRAFGLLNVDRIAIEKCVCCASLFSVRARERKRERKREEREKYLEAKKMKENENTETSVGFFFFFYKKGWVEFEYIVFRLNGLQ